VLPLNINHFVVINVFKKGKNFRSNDKVRLIKQMSETILKEKDLKFPFIFTKLRIE